LGRNWKKCTKSVTVRELSGSHVTCTAMKLSNPPNSFKRQGIDKVWPPKNLKRQGILIEEDKLWPPKKLKGQRILVGEDKIWPPKKLKR
jgi:hypothetical protein